MMKMFDIILILINLMLVYFVIGSIKNKSNFMLKKTVNINLLKKYIDYLSLNCSGAQLIVSTPDFSKKMIVEKLQDDAKWWITATFFVNLDDIRDFRQRCKELNFEINKCENLHQILVLGSNSINISDVEKLILKAFGNYTLTEVFIESKKMF